MDTHLGDSDCSAISTPSSCEQKLGDLCGLAAACLADNDGDGVLFDGI
jgi:hypothetical protein